MFIFTICIHVCILSYIHFFYIMAIFMPFCVILALFILLFSPLSAFLMVLRTVCILSFVFRSFFGELLLYLLLLCFRAT